MSNYEFCVEYVKEYSDPNQKDLSAFWTESYDNIESKLVVSRLFDIAVVLENNKQANTFCQRALKDFSERGPVIDGKLNSESVNEAIKKDLERPLALTTAHYALNYVQNRVRSREYGKYLRRFFR